MKNNKTKVI